VDKECVVELSNENEEGLFNKGGVEFESGNPGFE
jgi:hypothetical protein